jgi:acetoin:2,6-dichlorophenolindophenol oxidoreductase subunit alpha
VAVWRGRDPIVLSRAALEPAVGRERLEAIDREASAEVEAALEQALADPMPAFEPDAASAAWMEA